MRILYFQKNGWKELVPPMNSQAVSPQLLHILQCRSEFFSYDPQEDSVFFFGKDDVGHWGQVPCPINENNPNVVYGDWTWKTPEIYFDDNNPEIEGMVREIRLSYRSTNDITMTYYDEHGEVSQTFPASDDYTTRVWFVPGRSRSRYFQLELTSTGGLLGIKKLEFKVKVYQKEGD